MVRDDLSVASIDTDRVLVITKARLEDVGLVGSRSIVAAANAIVDVLAETDRVRSGGVASLEAELVTANEEGPGNALGWLSASSAGEAGGVAQATDGVTALVLASAVKLTAEVTVGKAKEDLVESASDLDVRRRLHELDSGEGTIRDTTAAVILGAPCDLVRLGIANGGVGGGGAPEAEVVKGVEKDGLAERVLAGSCAIALIITVLGTARRRRGIGLERDLVEGESLADEDGVASVGRVGVHRCG